MPRVTQGCLYWDTLYANQELVLITSGECKCEKYGAWPDPHYHYTQVHSLFASAFGVTSSMAKNLKAV